MTFNEIQSAIMVATAFHFVGAKASLNVWNPRLGALDEYTASQIWLLGGGPNDLESIEAGWMVYNCIYKLENYHWIYSFLISNSKIFYFDICYA